MREVTFEFKLRNPDRTVTSTGEDRIAARKKVIDQYGDENFVYGSACRIQDEKANADATPQDPTPTP